MSDDHKLDSEIDEEFVNNNDDEDDIIYYEDRDDDLSEKDDGDTPENHMSMVHSQFIDQLPDISLFTAYEARDSVCCLTCFAYKDLNKILIVTGSVDEKLRIYQVIENDKLKLINIYEDYTDSVVCAEFSKDGNFLAAGSYDTSIHIYTVLNFEHEKIIQVQFIHKLLGPSLDVEWIQWHPNSVLLAAGSKDTTVWFWNLPDKDGTCIINRYTAPATCGSFVDQGKIFCAGNQLININNNIGFADGVVDFRETDTLEPRCSIRRWNKKNKGTKKTLHLVAITCIKSHSIKPIIAIGSENGTLCVTNVSNSDHSSNGSLTGHTDSIEALAFLESSELFNNDILLASGSLDGTVRVWDCKCCFKHIDISGENSPIVGCVTDIKWLIEQNNLYLISASTDSTLRVWDIQNGICVKILSGHKNAILNLSVIENYIVSCGDDKTLKLWRI